MLPNKIHIYSHPEATAKAVVNMIIAKVNEKASLAQPFNMAVSGGSTPNLIFTILDEECSSKIPWNNVRVFWVDERCVPPADAESNFGTMSKLLLNKVSIPKTNIFNIRGDMKPETEVARYRSVLRNELPVKDGQPLFDLILLGIGNDGHTASIFPDNMALIHSPKTVETAKHPHSGQSRITLTGNVICNAGHIAFVITGRNKAVILDTILNEKDNFERCPAYHILTGSNAELYLDREATERL